MQLRTLFVPKPPREKEPEPKEGELRGVGVKQANAAIDCLKRIPKNDRLFAEMLGLPIYWVQEDVDFDIATINCTPKTWTLRDFAQKFAVNGSRDYVEGIEFADAHRLPIGTAFALLAGTINYSNIKDGFEDGTWRIKDRSWANAVAGVYTALVALSASVRSTRLIEACMAVCRVANFDPARLKTLLGLKADATMAMRERSATVKAAASKPNRKSG